MFLVSARQTWHSEANGRVALRWGGDLDFERLGERATRDGRSHEACVVFVAFDWVKFGAGYDA